MKNIRNIEAWLLASELVVRVYAVTAYDSDKDNFQIRRGALFVLENIARASIKDRKDEYLHCLMIAKECLVETEVLLKFVIQNRPLVLFTQKVSRFLSGLICAVELEIYEIHQKGEEYAFAQ